MAFQTLSASGSSNVYATKPPAVQICLAGGFGGGTVVIQRECQDGTFRDIDGATFTAAADVVIDFFRGSRIKAVLSGATGPTLYVEFY